MRIALSQIYIALVLLLGAPADTLVDRQHGLPRWYDPGMDAETLQALQSLQDEAGRDGIKVAMVSGYRSYQEQAGIFRRESGLRPDQASTYSAPQGHSEHQLGTAIDVAWPGAGFGAGDPRNELLYAWLEENAHRFGFVISYPYKTIERWPYDNLLFAVVTDYVNEPWHLRYLGPELSGTIFEAGYLDPESRVLPQDFYSPWP